MMNRVAVAFYLENAFGQCYYPMFCESKLRKMSGKHFPHSNGPPKSGSVCPGEVGFLGPRLWGVFLGTVIF